MGRKSAAKQRKEISPKVNTWLSQLLIKLQHENLEQLTMNDIARIANKSKSTIYEYFRSKEEVLRAACQTRITILFNSINQINEQQLTGVERYSQLIEIFAEGTTGISIAFLQSIRLNYPSVWVVVDSFINHFVALLESHYTEGIKEGIYNPISVELLSSLDKLFITQVVTNPAIFSDDKYTVSNLIRDYLNLRLTGLLKR